MAKYYGTEVDWEVRGLPVEVASATTWDLIEETPASSPTQAMDVVLTLDPSCRHAELETWCAMYGVPMDVYHGRRRQFRVRSSGPVYAEALVERLRDTSDLGGLLLRIVDGWSEEFDGSNWVGRLTEDAASAAVDLADALDDAEGHPSPGAGLWEPEDWIGNDPETAGLSPETTDADIEALADDILSDAQDEMVCLAGGRAAVIELLREMRSSLCEDGD